MRDRTLGLVEIEDFLDQRNPAPHIRLPDAVSPPEISVTAATLPLDLPDKIPLPTLSLDAECPTPYHIEIWAEKSTVNDVLEPLAEQYGLNLQTSLGEMSLTRCRELVGRAAGNGDRPVRIFYISDFDPGGQSMPVATARKIEWVARERGDDLDIQLQPVVLTKDQCERYRLPRTPIKEKESRAATFEARHGEGGTELDALEALHPGELRSILLAEINRFYDADLPEEWDEACQNVGSDLDEIASHLADGHAEAITGLQARLDQLRADADRLQADAALVLNTSAMLRSKKLRPRKISIFRIRKIQTNGTSRSLIANAIMSTRSTPIRLSRASGPIARLMGMGRSGKSGRARRRPRHSLHVRSAAPGSCACGQANFARNAVETRRRSRR